MSNRRLPSLSAVRDRLTSSRKALAALVAVAVVLLVVVVAGVAVAIGSGSEDDEEATDGGDATEEVTYLEVADDLQLTAPGTQLALGEAATLAWQPSTGAVGVVEFTVVSAQPAPAGAFDGWIVGGAATQAVGYFVTVAITNLGETDLGGQYPPVYLEREDGTLAPAARFGGEFPACGSTALPAPFATDATATLCEVYLSEGGQPVTAMTFLPADGSDAISWDLSAPAASSTSAPATSSQTSAPSAATTSSAG